MARGKRANATGRNDTVRYVKLDHWLLESKAAKALSGDAFKLLIYVWKRHNGANNGSISFSVREAEEIGFSKSGASRSFTELIDKGFLSVSQPSCFALKTKESREWELTAEGRGGKPAAKVFMRWVPAVPPVEPNGVSDAVQKNKTRSHPWDRPSQNQTRHSPTGGTLL